VPWMGVEECVQFHHYPHIVHSEDTDSYGYVVARMDRAYHPSLGLKSYERHYLYIKPGILLVADDFSLSEKGSLQSYPSKDMKLSGGLEFGWADYIVGKQGKATAIFNGVPGEYRIGLNYLDNFPGEGSFEVQVNGKTIHQWQTVGRNSDNNYVFTPPVRLAPGSRISFVGSDMPHNCRLMRMVAFSRSAQSRRSASWLLHAETSAQVDIDKSFGTVKIVNGPGALDIFTVSPDAKAATIAVEDWEILEPDTEIKATKRIVLTPQFDGDRMVLINLLHTRSSAGKGIEDLQSSMDSSGDALTAGISWRLDGKLHKLNWDIHERSLQLDIN